MCSDGILGEKPRADLKLEMGKLLSIMGQNLCGASACIRRPKIIPKFIMVSFASSSIGKSLVQTHKTLFILDSERLTLIWVSAATTVWSVEINVL